MKIERKDYDIVINISGFSGFVYRRLIDIGNDNFKDIRTIFMLSENNLTYVDKEISIEELRIIEISDNEVIDKILVNFFNKENKLQLSDEFIYDDKNNVWKDSFGIEYNGLLTSDDITKKIEKEYERVNRLIEIDDMKKGMLKQIEKGRKQKKNILT